MKIEELKNQRVKISARSLTCKDENGKTKGVVTCAENFLNLRPNLQFQYAKIVRNSGLWSAGESKNVFLIDGKLYYLFDLSPIEFYEKYYAGKSGWDNEKEKCENRKSLAESAAKYMEVIPCYIVK